MSSFTKGKWEACVDGSVDLKDDSGRVIDVYSGILRQYPNEGELMANARLIAAAPEMYCLIADALKMCWGREVYASLYDRALDIIKRIDSEDGNHEE